MCCLRVLFFFLVMVILCFLWWLCIYVEFWLLCFMVMIVRFLLFLSRCCSMWFILLVSM